MFEQLEELLTTSEAAAYPKTSQYTIWRWCKEGRLPAFQLGREWRIRKTRLDQLIVELERERADLNGMSGPDGAGSQQTKSLG
jgi:excisionase family DNA binding protein